MTKAECDAILATLPRYGMTYRIVSMGVCEVLDIRPIPGGQFVLVTDLQAALTGEDQAPLSEISTTPIRLEAR